MERAALSLAASVVSSIFSMLGAKAAPYFGGDITDDEMQHLQNIILPKFRTVLRVAEAVPVDELKPWLTTLQDAAYEAEDVLDMYEYKRLEDKVSPLPNCSLKQLKSKAKGFFAPLSLKTELKKSMEKLRQSANEADKLISLYGAISQTPFLRATMKQQELPTVSSLSSPVFGRDEERESLVNMLISPTNEHKSSKRNTPILAIYGLGGAGKTTLTQHVYNDSRVVEHFDMRMWVHVSRKFDVHKITTEIIEHFTKQGEDSDKFSSLNVLQMKLKDLLKSKKYLLVLDDIWCQDIMEWDQMLVPLNEVGDTGSKILVTTRTKEVASRLGIEDIVALNDLESKYCMSISKHYSFGDANKVIRDPELAIVAEQIMKKLEKSPLSARMVGCLLRREKNVANWKWILKEDEMMDTIDTLYLSFDSLTPHLQRCFAFCSLYPKGFHFDQWEVDALVRLWIAQGLVVASYNNNMTIEDKGMQYFNELVSYSFFQKETTSYGRYYYVMHDLLHDLSEEISKDDCFRIEDDGEHIPTNVRHLSIIITRDLPSQIPPLIFKLVNLRTFMIMRQISEAAEDRIFDGRDKVFQKFKKLRVLRLGYYRSMELHKSIGELKYLCYLQVDQEVECLPESLGRLYNLQFLNLGWCSLTEKVPENLKNLINLRLLNAFNEIISEIPFFGNLVSLQNIKKYNASRKKGHEISQLKNLQQLRGSLHINNLENVQNKAEASEASLKEKKLLEELVLAWKHSPERDGRIDDEVIKGLDPPPNLNVLKIEGYNGIRYPKWLQNGGLSNAHLLCLSKLFLENCPNLKQVQNLPSTIKQLEIRRCRNLCEVSSLPLHLRIVKVGDCSELMQLSPFPPNLEELEIAGCPGVEALLSNILLFEDGDQQHNQKQQEKDNQQHFPLKSLYIVSCSVPRKKRLYFDPNKLFTSLSSIILCELPWLTVLHLDDNLTSLGNIIIKDCENMELFGSSLASFPSLQCLKLYNFPRLTMQYLQPEERSFLLPSSLKSLEFHNCGDPEMNLLGRCMIGLTSLTRLYVGGYSQVRSLPDLANPGAIRYLQFSDCPELTSMWNLKSFTSLENLHIIRCPRLINGIGERLPSFLKRLTIDDLLQLTVSLSQREFLNSLLELRIESCAQDIAFTQQEELPQHLNSLTDLYIQDCPNLTSLPVDLKKLSSLRKLCIYRCPKIELLPKLPASLEELLIDKFYPQLNINKLLRVFLLYNGPERSF